MFNSPCRAAVVAVSILVALSAAAKDTGPGAPGRFIFMASFLSSAEAASSVAFDADSLRTQPLIPTGSAAVPYLRWLIFYCHPPVGAACSVAAPPPPPFPIYSQEFPGTLGAALELNRIGRRFRHSGMFTTSEGSVIVWGFSEP
jgi:hypothetical protein